MMNQRLPVRFIDAKENDLEMMLGIYNYFIVHTSVLFDYEGINVDEFRNRIYINNDSYKTYVVNLQNEIAGFCFLTQFRRKIAYDKAVEIGIYLKPEFTGKGLGQHIVKYLESIAKSNQFEVIIASISGENSQSINLFKKLNYEQCAHYKAIAEKFGRKLDIIDFQKRL